MTNDKELKGHPCMHACHPPIFFIYTYIYVCIYFIGRMAVGAVPLNGSQHNNKSVNIMAKDTLVIGRAYA